MLKVICKHATNMETSSYAFRVRSITVGAALPGFKIEPE